MIDRPLPDAAVRKAREATQALIEASIVVLHDLRHNQHDLEHLLSNLRGSDEHFRRPRQEP